MTPGYVGRRLGALLADAATSTALLRDATVHGVLDGSESDVSVSGVVQDSRAVQAGSLFCCVRGEHVDGHDFATRAVDQGAVALLVDHVLDVDVPQIVTSDTRSATGHLAAAFWGRPSSALTMVGVTGTNGKTTTTSFIAAVLEAAGMPTGVIGTLTGKHTTPESTDLQPQLAAFRDGGKRAVVMEVSSHALALDRVAGCRYDVGVFTNLGRDHLDLHGTLDAYFAAKARLFEPGVTEHGVTNLDDTHGAALFGTTDIRWTGYSRRSISDVRVTPTEHSYRWEGEVVVVHVGGEFNVMNSLAAATACRALGISPSTIARGLAAAPPVPGRFEPVRAGQPFDVIVDYAHTPDGLGAALGAARSALDGGRLIVVFGCGGDRDREKRPQMGLVASTLADRVVVTSDNPRSEDPDSIINAIISGVPGDYRDRVVSDPDRRRAFSLAFQQARPGDVVVIAGKGHETTQTIGDRILPFDDRAVARAVLGGAALGGDA
jgi:UDP-N-acetylmuramoyl-L-alanyl-D-glutamate--2,6-diaminopimelate ligase